MQEVPCLENMLPPGARRKEGRGPVDLVHPQAAVTDPVQVEDRNLPAGRGLLGGIAPVGGTAIATALRRRSGRRGRLSCLWR